MPGASILSAIPIGDKHLVLCPASDGSAVLRATDPKDTAVYQFTQHAGKVVSAAVSRDGKHLLTASQDHTLIRWSLATRKSNLVLQNPSVTFCCVAISPDGKHAVSGGADKELRLWDLTTGKAIRGLPGHTSTIWSVAISPNGKFALSGSADGTMRLWSLGP